MFCEDFDKFNKVYTMKGGRRGQGTICFLVSRIAKLRAQLEVANAKIEELKKENIRLQIPVARLNGKNPYVVYVEEPATPGPLRSRSQHHGAVLPQRGAAHEREEHSSVRRF